MEKYLKPLIRIGLKNIYHQLSLLNQFKILMTVKHINKYGTMHTDSIITKIKHCKKFLANVNSSIAMHNTSTQLLMVVSLVLR